MIDDPIVAEVRNARDEYARRFDYNVDAICQDLQRKQLQPGRKIVSFSPRRPKPVIEAQVHISDPPVVQSNSDVSD